MLGMVLVMSLHPLVLLEHSCGNLFVFKMKRCSSRAAGQSSSGEESYPE